MEITYTRAWKEQLFKNHHCYFLAVSVVIFLKIRTWMDLSVGWRFGKNILVTGSSQSVLMDKRLLGICDISKMPAWK